MSRPARIAEIKRHPDGSSHRFECDLVLRKPHVAVVVFGHWRGRSAGGFRIPRGSLSYGFFWTRRNYSLYRTFAPNGRLIADRYDIVEDMRIHADEVSYLDLYLDIWIAPDGSAVLEDEDEVREAVAAGLLSKARVRGIERARDLVLRRHGAIVRETEKLLMATGSGSALRASSTRRRR